MGTTEALFRRSSCGLPIASIEDGVGGSISPKLALLFPKEAERFADGALLLAHFRVNRTSCRDEKGMFERCLNPDCGLPFDYREGRLIRVPPAGPKSPSERSIIEHFWLCGKCSERYVFPHEREAGMKIKLRVEEPQETAVRALAATV